MKNITVGIFFLCIFSGSVYGEESARTLARGVIAAEEGRTMYVDRPSEDKIEAIATRAERRLNLLMMSDKAPEEMVLAYAILVLDRGIAYARDNDGTGVKYHAMVAQRRILAERLLRLDQKSVGR